MSSTNSFALLDNLNDQAVVTLTTPPVYAPITILSALSAPIMTVPTRSFGGKSWADIDDDDDDDFDFQFPTLGTNPVELKMEKEKLQKEQEQAQKKAAQALSKSLANKREIKIPHTRRLFNAEGRDNGIEILHRTLRVVTKNSYDNLLRLVNRHKSHDKNGRLNHQEQRSKIKLANSLLETAYKAPNEPRFIYHVAIIHLSNGTDLIRGEVVKDSNAAFELEERFYEP